MNIPVGILFKHPWLGNKIFVLNGQTSIPCVWSRTVRVKNHSINIHTYRSRFIPEGIAEASQIFIQDAIAISFYHNYLAMSNITYMTGSKPIARSQSTSGVSANNTVVTFYDIHGRKRELLIFYFVSDTTRCCPYQTDLFYRYSYLTFLTSDPHRPSTGKNPIQR
jgi:hypothetical protein